MAGPAARSAWSSLVTRPTIFGSDRLFYHLDWAKKRKDVARLADEMLRTQRRGAFKEHAVTPTDWCNVAERLASGPDDDSLCPPSTVGRLAAQIQTCLSRAELPDAADAAFACRAFARIRLADGQDKNALGAVALALADHAAANAAKLATPELFACLSGLRLASVDSPRTIVALLARAAEDACRVQLSASDVALVVETAAKLPERERNEVKGAVARICDESCQRHAVTYAPEDITTTLAGLVALGTAHLPLVRLLAERCLSPHIAEAFEAAPSLYASVTLSLGLLAVPDQRMLTIPAAPPTHARTPILDLQLRLPKRVDTVKRGIVRADAEANWTPSGDCLWGVQNLVAHNATRALALAPSHKVHPSAAAGLLRGCALLGYSHELRTPLVEGTLLQQLQHPRRGGGGHPS
eukprot:Hpha_TRINITY_DN15397_c0_g1::TRINITY_DN15397_c0_g1_i1::g.88044::m.88044